MGTVYEPSEINQDTVTIITKKALNQKYGTNFVEDSTVTPELVEEINKHPELRNPDLPDPAAERTEAAISCPEDPHVVDRAAGTLAKDCDATYDHYSIPGRQADQGPDFSVNHNVQQAMHEYNYCLEHGTKPAPPSGRPSTDTGPIGPAQSLSSEQNVPYVKTVPTVGNFPHQRDVLKVYGPMGQNQASVPSPYPLYVYGKQSNSIKAHEMVVESIQRVLTRVADHYGLQQVHALKLDIFAGGMCVRKMKGGNNWSMHSWGIALDWHPDANGFKVNHTAALFAQPIYTKWWQLWEQEGWLSLGRARDFDWMHVQAARL